MPSLYSIRYISPFLRVVHSLALYSNLCWDAIRILILQDLSDRVDIKKAQALSSKAAFFHLSDIIACKKLA